MRIKFALALVALAAAVGCSSKTPVASPTNTGDAVDAAEVDFCTFATVTIQEQLQAWLNGQEDPEAADAALENAIAVEADQSWVPTEIKDDVDLSLDANIEYGHALQDADWDTNAVDPAEFNTEEHQAANAKVAAYITEHCK